MFGGAPQGAAHVPVNLLFLKNKFLIFSPVFRHTHVWVLKGILPSYGVKKVARCNQNPPKRQFEYTTAPFHNQHSHPRIRSLRVISNIMWPSKYSKELEQTLVRQMQSDVLERDKR